MFLEARKAIKEEEVFFIENKARKLRQHDDKMKISKSESECE